MNRVRVLSFIAWVLVSLWSRSIKVHYVNSGLRDRFKAEGKNFIYAFWHGNMFLLLHSNRHSRVLIPVSESSDGEIMAKLLNRFGFGVVRGSSSRNGHKALFGMVCGVRSGKTIGVAVDGPRGPFHEAKKGAAFLAATMNVPIIPVATGAKQFWTLESTWEKFMLPVPFTEGLVMFGDPVYVNGVSEEEIEDGRKRLEQALRTLTRETLEQAAVLGQNHIPEQAYGSFVSSDPQSTKS